VFREYIIQFARLVDVDLTGDPIVIGNNGAKLIFLGTNSNTAQSHNGDLYVDEIFWIPNFQKLRKVASGMASQKHLRSTYFSTPPRWRTVLTLSGLASCSTRDAAVSPTASTLTSVTARSPVVSSATMDSGGRLSPLRTRLPVAVPCSTSTSSNAKT
jgi:hypothetical protein